MRNIPTLKTLMPESVKTVHTESMGIMVSTSYATGKSVYFTKFRGSGTWDKSPSCKYVIIYAWNGGFGGGGGSSTSAPAGQAGSGGAGGNSLVMAAPATFFSASTNITVGAGGLGGAGSGSGVVLNPGNDGGIGGQTSIGNIAIPFNAIGVGQGGGNGLTGGGKSGSSSYVLSNGYSIADGTAIGGNARSGATTPVEQKSAFWPDTTIVGSSTVRIPCNPYAVATGGGGGTTPSGSTSTAPGYGGDIYLFGSIIQYGGTGVDQIVGNTGLGRYFCWPGSSYANLYNAQLLVTGGTGGAGSPSGSNTSAPFVPAGGVGGVPGGGGGGGGAGSSSPLVNGSSAGGNAGRGEVWIFEFV